MSASLDGTEGMFSATAGLAVALASDDAPGLGTALQQALRAGLEPIELLEIFGPLHPGLREALTPICVDAGKLMPPIAHILDLGDFRTTVADTHGALPPIVLLHSMALDWRAVHHLFPLLAPHRRVIALDLRGHGVAAETTRLDSLEQAADDLRRVLDRLDVPRAELVGLSMGGLVAQQFAVRFPERISALSLVCTTPKGVPAMARRAEDGERHGPASLLADTLLRWIGPGEMAANSWAARYARERILACPAGHWGAAWRCLAAADFGEDLASFRMPVKVIAGGADQSSPVQLKWEMARGIPGARFILIPDAPHFVSLVQPQALAAELLN